MMTKLEEGGHKLLDKHLVRQNIELLVLVFAMFVLALLHSWVNPVLAFNRGAIEAGQWWRVLTCNFAHLSINHMLLNVSTFVLTSVLFKADVPPREWYLNLTFCCFAVGLGIFFFDSNTVQYVGFSGALYGILAFGAILNFRRSKLISIIVYAYIANRIYLQNSAGFDPSTMSKFIGGNVIASSHLFGFITGNVFGVICLSNTLKSTLGSKPSND